MINTPIESLNVYHYVVMGAGAWGTAMAIHLARYNDSVTLLCRNEAFANILNCTRENTAYLPEYRLPDNLNITSNANCLNKAIVFIAIPIVGLKSALLQIHNQEAYAAIRLCKGVESNTGYLPCELTKYLNMTLPTGTLSGPSFAQEVAQNLPTALTIATSHIWLRSHIQKILHHHTMRVYTSQDVIGVEVGGAIKNIIALACGVSDGLNLGLNARAALITRGLAEAVRLTQALGGNVETLMGLTGLGDLVLTCTGHLSRNRNYGLLLAKGYLPNTIETELGHVAEGARCVQAVAKRAYDLGIDMPIVNSISQLILGKLCPQTVLETLLSREATSE